VSDAKLYGLLAEFDTPEKLVDAAKAMRGADCGELDAFSPFPVEGLAEALGFRTSAVQAATLIGGIVGAAGGFLMQVYTNVDFPIWIGGRPLVAVPAFMLITFELMVLGAVLACIGTMLVANRLPRLNHPVFEAKEFNLGRPDRFVLAVLDGPGFDRDKAGKALAQLKPEAIVEIPQAPE
jgi:hypothetical protein